jgi:hypothetical protein
MAKGILHAVVTPVTLKDRSGAEAELGAPVAQVSGIPGIVAGYWVAI